MEVLTAGGLTTLFIEGIKLLWRKLIKKDPLYDFPTAFYTISIPLLNALMVFPLYWLQGQPSPLIGMGWIDLLKYLGGILVGSLVSLVSYTQGLKPLKVYSVARIEAKKLENGV